MAHMLQKLDLAIGSLGVNRRLKGTGDLLDGHADLPGAVIGGADQAVGARAENLQVLVSAGNLPDAVSQVNSNKVSAHVDDEVSEVSVGASAVC